MATRAVHIIVDANDPARLAAFWAAALRWELDSSDPQVPSISPVGFSYPAPDALPLVFVPVPDVKAGKNRVHLDLTSESAQDQAEQVSRLLTLGASRTDIGQGDVAWEVLADPEGNEFCVLEPREVYANAGPVAAVIIDCADPVGLAGFWSVASGWSITESGSDFAALHSASEGGPFLEMLRVPDSKLIKNRIHVDVAPATGGDTRAEASRLRDEGARPADVGQGDETWVVLADPEGNEFCVLSPR